MRFARPALAASILLALAAPAALAQNLVTNANFDTNVDYWSPGMFPPFPPPGLIAWSPLDWAGNPNSGSALLTNDSSGPSTTSVRVSECIAVPTTATYEFGAHIRIPGGQGTTGEASVVPVVWDLAGCFGFATTASYPGTTVTTATTDVWVPILIQGVLLTQHGVQLSLRVTKNQAGGTLSAHFDFARFGLQGTTPVELHAFEIE
jgi:hypothetical protein